MITAEKLINAIKSGANNLKNNQNLVNEMNIFPVPDGDTGTNMSMTIASAFSELDKIESENLSVSCVFSVVSSALLRGSRGNSGVILALLFKGIYEGSKNLIELDGRQFVDAFAAGVDSAYKAVMNPVEGTILTVARIAKERGKEAALFSNDEVYVLEAMLNGATDALKKTPEFLPVLKKAKVLDAGGKGLCLILEGMLSVLKDGNIIAEKSLKNSTVQNSQNNFSIFNDPNISSFNHQNSKFTYCTEFVVKRHNSEQNTDALKEDLAKIGDCVVTVCDDEIIKTHVHTNNPDIVLGNALKYGDLLKVKIDNMKEQNKKAIESHSKSNDTKIKNEEEELKPLKPVKDFGFVAVSLGKGLTSLFKELGCDHVVSGGQTMNPSTKDIANAALATPAKTVFILPNNKNIFLAAEQVHNVIKDRNIEIIPSKTIPQGICAMLSFDSEKSSSENLNAMLQSTKKVVTGQITFASRNAEFGGFKIKKDDVLSLIDGKLVHKSKNLVKETLKLIRLMVKKETEFITIIYGSYVKEDEAFEFFELVKNKFGSKIEVSLVNGGQPIYPYIISVE